MKEYIVTIKMPMRCHDGACPDVALRHAKEIIRDTEPQFFHVQNVSLYVCPALVMGVELISEDSRL